MPPTLPSPGTLAVHRSSPAAVAETIVRRLDGWVHRTFLEKRRRDKFLRWKLEFTALIERRDIASPKASELLAEGFGLINEILFNSKLQGVICAWIPRLSDPNSLGESWEDDDSGQIYVDIAQDLSRGVCHFPINASCKR